MFPADIGRSNLLLSPPSGTGSDAEVGQIVEFASGIAQRYELSSLIPLLASCGSAISRAEVSVAVVGRFKAGKSSFINHFANRALLPVGVVPVTTVVTEVGYGLSERAAVQFLDGSVWEIRIDDIAQYVSERHNPENLKQVKLITVDLPGLARFQRLKFVDTPGLESTLIHNTEEALKWLPNVGLALVAVSVDPPLSQQDIELIRRLYRFTPNVTVLLTKADLLAPAERSEVVAFVTERLAKDFEIVPQVVPYSIRSGYEDCRTSLEQNVFQPLLAGFGEQREAIIRRKIDTLLCECLDYLTFSLKCAELVESERQSLKDQLVGKDQAVASVKTELHLVAQHTAAGARSFVENLFQAYHRPVGDRLLHELADEFPKWTKSLAFLLDSFDQWLGKSLAQRLAEAAVSEQSRLTEPLQRTAQQLCRILQDFRERLSQGTMRAFGLPLRTTEVEFEVQHPRSPDILVGKIFDRNWELLSPIVPVALIRGVVRRHFERQVSYKLSTNISRLVSQWEDVLNTALLNVEREAQRRLDELVATVERLIEASGDNRLPAIRQDLEKIELLRKRNCR
jgi:GTP-binding protein EngB required for normal cell division